MKKKFTGYFISFFILPLLFFLITCNTNENNLSVFNEGDKLTECYDPPDRCPVPYYCNSGKGDHFCLLLRHQDTMEEFDYNTIDKVKVTNVGYDCNNNYYYCSYVTDGGSTYGMGCVLPWCNDACSYTRSVCLVTNDNKTYVGSVYFEYINYSGCFIDVYETEAQCDFGGIEE